MLDQLFFETDKKTVVAHNVLKIAWVNFNSVSITNLQENLFLLEFESENYKKLILDQSPGQSNDTA